MMPQISFVKNKAILDVPVGTNLMQALLDAQIPVASSCHGDGVCRKCTIHVVEGLANLSEKNQTELGLLERNPLAPNQRVSCQTEVLGNLKVDTGYW